MSGRVPSGQIIIFHGRNNFVIKRSMKYFYFAVIVLILVSCGSGEKRSDFLPGRESDLKFNQLAGSWDEAIPLGNGMLGALIWEKDKRLRFSLDRADLWDLRPMENLDKPEWKYSAG